MAENRKAEMPVVIDGKIIPSLDLSYYLDARLLTSVAVHHNICNLIKRHNTIIPAKETFNGTQPLKTQDFFGAGFKMCYVD